MSTDSFAQYSRIQKAIYTEQSVPAYRDNPLIAALPSILTRKDAYNSLYSRPEYDENDRKADQETRIHMVGTVSRLFLPLNVHIQVERAFARAIRMGYVGKRNPLVRGFHDDLDQSVQRIRYDLDTFQNQVTNQGSFSVIGISGVGKTWMVKRILNTYPQAIRHCQYKDRQLSMFQLVWLMLQTPHDGSIKALARQFFIEVDNLLGTQYAAAYAGPRVTAEDMLVSMARLAGLLNLGVLVIDEIQTLVKSKGGKEQILSFLLQLDNQLGLPIVLVGTPQASALFEKNLRLARRFLGDSAAIFSRMRKDKEWESFVSGLWQYQYTFNKIPLTRSLTDTLYERTQGIGRKLRIR
jgi:hypothetical protein